MYVPIDVGMNFWSAIFACTLAIATLLAIIAFIGYILTIAPVYFYGLYLQLTNHIFDKNLNKQ